MMVIVTDVTKKMIKCFTFEKEEREKQNSMKIKANVLLVFWFW
jgi:hypothetical protein